MFTFAFKLYARDQEKYSKTVDIQQYFEKIFSEFDNKSLVPINNQFGNEGKGITKQPSVKKVNREVEQVKQ